VRLTLYSDYALRLLMYLAVAPGRSATIQQVAERYGISRNHLMKVAHELGRSGFVETLRGRGGGLHLRREPGEIGLGDVIRSTEEDFRMVECFDETRNTCILAGRCRLTGVLREALAAYLKVLDSYTLADLIATPRQLQQLLGLGLDSRAAS
jgi:Rrf2 family nitric oxide-sensitive transcriptional repressor